MLSEIRPITVLAGCVAIGTISTAGLHAIGLHLEKPVLREIGNWVFPATGSPFRELGRYGAMPLGSAVLTGAGRLPFKGIIHVARRHRPIAALDVCSSSHWRKPKRSAK